MKKLLLLLTCIILTSCGGYKATTVTIDEMSKSFEVQGEKDDLYVKANQWMVENFNSAKSVIQFSDKDAGIVSGKYYMATPMVVGSNYQTTTNEIFAIIKLQVKDGAAKISVDPEDYAYSEGMGITNVGEYREEDVRAKMENLIANYEDYMINSNATDF